MKGAGKLDIDYVSNGPCADRDRWFAKFQHTFQPLAIVAIVTCFASTVYPESSGQAAWM